MFYANGKRVKYPLIHCSSSFRNEGCRAVMISHLAGTWEEFAKETALPATLDAGEPAHRPGRPQQHRHQALARRLPGVEGGRALVALQLLQLGKH